MFWALLEYPSPVYTLSPPSTAASVPIPVLRDSSGRSFCQVLPSRCVWTGPRVSLCLWSVKGCDLITCLMRRTQFFLQGFSKKGFAFPARVPRLQTNTYRNQPDEARVRKFQSPVWSPREVTDPSLREAEARELLLGPAWQLTQTFSQTAKGVWGVCSSVPERFLGIPGLWVQLPGHSRLRPNSTCVSVYNVILGL